MSRDSGGSPFFIIWVICMDRCIEKKAYLGREDLTELVICEEIDGIGDWAFAGCRNLRRIALPETVSEIGRDIFKDSLSLSMIAVCSMEKLLSSGLFPMLSKQEAILARLRVDSFLHFPPSNPAEMIATDPAKWVPALTDRLSAFLIRPDDAGFVPFLASGEEDYEEGDAARGLFMEKRKRAKCQAAADRLMLDEVYRESAGNAEKAESTAEAVSLTGIGEREVGKVLQAEKKESKIEAVLLTDKESAQLAEVLKSSDAAYVVLAESRELLEESVKLYSKLGLLSPAAVTVLMTMIPQENIQLRSLCMRYTNKTKRFTL